MSISVDTQNILDKIMMEYTLKGDLFPSVLVAFFTVIVAFLLMKVFLKQRSTSKRGIPFPPLAPWGMLETIKNMQSNTLPSFYLKTAEALGHVYTFRLSLPFSRMFVVTGDATLAREVLTDPKTVKPDLYLQFEPEGIGNIFTRNGSFWHVRRKGTAPAFSASNIKRMNKVAMDMAERWIQETLIPSMQENKAFDAAKEMINVTLDTICKTGFEYDPTKEEKEDFLYSLELVTREFLSRSLTNPARKYLGKLLPKRYEAVQAARRNKALAKRIIQNYRSNSSPTKGTIVDLIANNDCYANDDEMAVDLIIYLLAGHDTTGYTLAFTLLELARHPDEQKKIRDELKKLAPEDWSTCKAVQMVVRESMRLHPVSAGGSLRQVGRDVTTKEGFFIPKGSHVVSCMMLLHHNPKVFENPDQFIPSRWENPTKEMKDAFLIFSAGKQNCIGQALANAELHCIIPMILSKVELEVEDEGSTDYFLTLKPSGALLKGNAIETTN